MYISYFSISGGVPNITGSVCNAYDGDRFGESGAFYHGSPWANSGFGFDGNWHGTYSAALFNASRSSSIYGAYPNGVRPDAVQVRVKTRYK